MKSPLTYLLLTKLKNGIKSLVKSPAKLIYAICIGVIVVIVILTGNKTGPTSRTLRDIGELTAIVTAFYSIMFLLLAYKGFGSGTTMFSMADVSFVFPAPFRQRTVLFYGLFQQMGTSLLLGFFVFFQYSWMHNVYGVGFGTVLLILLGYALTVFAAQILAMVIYAFTSADDKRRTVVKAVFFLVVAGFLGYVAATALGDQAQLLPRAAAAISGPIVGLFPVSGWLGHCLAGILGGNIGAVVLGLVLYGVLLVGLVLLIVYGKQDFYEDVLKSSEIAQSAITARKEGRGADAAPSRVRVGKTGLSGGEGAAVFYRKHLLENRRARALILDPMSLTFAIIAIALGFFTKSAGIASVFTTATIFQIFTVALGRFNKELTKPYIYLIPEPPLKKMLWALMELLPSAVLEALIIFIPVALIQHAAPFDVVLCIAARISFAFLFTAVNVAIARLWGGNPSMSLVMLLYFALLAVMAAPGVVLAAVLGSMYQGAVQNAVVFLSLMACNIPVSLLVLFLCRNMLQYAELNQR